jgi:hypothetical protein
VLPFDEPEPEPERDEALDRLDEPEPDEALEEEPDGRSSERGLTAPERPWGREVDEVDGVPAAGVRAGAVGRTVAGGRCGLGRDGASARTPPTTRRAGGADSTPRRSLRGGTTTDGRSEVGVRERGERA